MIGKRQSHLVQNHPLVYHTFVRAKAESGDVFKAKVEPLLTLGNCGFPSDVNECVCPLLAGRFEMRGHLKSSAQFLRQPTVLKTGVAREEDTDSGLGERSGRRRQEGRSMKLRRHSTVLGLELPVLEAIAAATPAPVATAPVVAKKAVPVVVLPLKTSAATRMMRSSSIDN